MSLLGRVFRQRKALALAARAAESSFVAQARTPETHSKHKRLQPLYDLSPEFGESCYIAPNATVAGEVYIDDSANIWDRAVVRGDLNAVRIFHMAAIKENVTISTVSNLPTGIPSVMSVGPFSVIQPGCTLVSCTIGSQVLVGARSVVLEGAKIEDESVIGPDSVVPPGRLIPSHQLWAGNPVRYVRDLTKAEIWTVKVLAHENFDKGVQYEYEQLSLNTAYLLKENQPSENEDLWKYKPMGIKHEELDNVPLYK